MSENANTGAAPVESAPQAGQVDESQVEGGEGLEASGEEAIVENAAAVLNDPNATKAEVKEAKKMLKSLKIKVDGKEYTEELPFEIADDPKQIEWMTKNLQLSKVSQRRMQEKSEMEAEVKAFLENLREDPESVLSDPRMNIDLKKLATKIIEQELENEKKSPAELKAEALEKKLKAIEAQQEKENETRKAKDKERMEAEAYERYDMLMDKAFKDNPDVPKTPAAIERISQYMMLGIKNGLDVSPGDVMHIVREELDNEFKQKLSGVTDDMLEAMIGKERLTALQKKRVAKAKASQAAQVAPKVPDTGKKAETKDEAKKIKTIRDMFGV